MSKKLLFLLSLGSVYILWGSTYLAIRFALDTVPPFLICGSRFLLAGALLFPFAKYTSGEKIKKEHIKTTAIIGLMLLFAGNGSVTWAEQYVPSGLTALIISFSPLFMVLTDWIRPGGKYPSHRIMAAIFVGLIGVALFFGGDVLPQKSAEAYTGIGLLFLAMISWSVGSIYSRSAVLPKSSLLAVSMEMIAAGLFFILLSFILREPMNWDYNISLVSALSILYLMIFGSIIAFSAYIWLLHNTSPAIASTHAFVNPVIALFLGWFLAEEIITSHTIAASAVILVSIIVITASKSGKEEQPVES